MQYCWCCVNVLFSSIWKSFFFFKLFATPNNLVTPRLYFEIILFKNLILTDLPEFMKSESPYFLWKIKIDCIGSVRIFYQYIIDRLCNHSHIRSVIFRNDSYLIRCDKTSQFSVTMLDCFIDRASAHQVLLGKLVLYLAYRAGSSRWQGRYIFDRLGVLGNFEDLWKRRIHSNL